jgi:predicted acylesterase/phospholipase RssA
MRVAWQAGVVLALDEAGIAFDHLDGTSGGIMNTAALMSGVAPADLCRRWADLPVRRFASPLPWRRYLRAPNLRGWGDADGIRSAVFPHLGINEAAIRSRTSPEATFNVTNFDDKISVAIEHLDITIDHLVAGMSLPIAMPPVQRDGVTWTDAVWIRDANLVEAERRGAGEIWLAWCIGNTGRYGNGPLEQYVHMIEMSAAGALNAELAAIAERNRSRPDPVRIHVIKPQYPLPLDTEFFTGRIDARTLVAMGYRDARRYLAGGHIDGVPLDVDASKMTEPGLGVRFSTTARGRLAGEDTTIRTTAEMHDIDDNPTRIRPAIGSLTCGPTTHYLYNGAVHWQQGRLHLDADVDLPAGPSRITVERHFDDGLLRGLGSCQVTLESADGTIDRARFSSSRREVVGALTSIEPCAAHGLRDRVHAIRRLSQLTRSQ